jgi:hypothetical protein
MTVSAFDYTFCESCVTRTACTKCVGVLVDSKVRIAFLSELVSVDSGSYSLLSRLLLYSTCNNTGNVCIT